MLIQVKVKVKQKESEIKLLPKQSFLDNDMDFYLVKVKSLPIDNKANLEIINLLSKFFKVSKKLVILKRGSSSNNKIFEIKNL